LFDKKETVMYSIIVGAVALFLLPLLLSRWKKETFSGVLVFSAAFGVIGGIIGLFTALALAHFVPVKTARIGAFALVSMRTANSLSGTFIWGTGSIKSATIYRVYVKNVDGSDSPYSLPADPTAAIFEDANLHDRGEWTVTQTGYDSSAPLAKWAINGANEPQIANQFHVPKGTVLNEFSAQ